VASCFHYSVLGRVEMVIILSLS